MIKTRSRTRPRTRSKQKSGSKVFKGSKKVNKRSYVKIMVGAAVAAYALKKISQSKPDIAYDLITQLMGNELYTAEFYTQTIKSLNKSLKKDPDYKSDLIIKTEPLNKTNFFLYAVYFYKINANNKAYEIGSRSTALYSALDDRRHKYIARGTCFINDSIFNLYKVINGRITVYRFGFAIKNATSNHDFVGELIQKINPKNKKIMCISLLTPCNKVLCTMIKGVRDNFSERIKASLMETDVMEKEITKINDVGGVFLNIPMSKNLGNQLYSRGIKQEDNEVAEYLDSLIDVSTGEKTFITLVNIASEYYTKYEREYTLCYHCKSGKDRTSLCDAVMQATFYHLSRTLGSNYYSKDLILEPEDYLRIKDYSVQFLYYGYIITFYSTAIPGLKLGNMPISKYLLDNEKVYKFFYGNPQT